MEQLEDRDVANGQCKSEVEIDLFHTEKTPMSANMTVIGLVNGMIGGTCLVLPNIGLRTGWAMSILVCLVTGWISYYTAYLIVLHLGKGSQIKDCILNHFNNDYRYMTGYSFFIWFSFMPIMLIYFRIICLQIEGLMGHHSDYTAPLVAVGLVFIIIFVRVKHIGEETLAYGIISIIGYILFLIWAHFSAPEGPKTVQAFGKPTTLSTTLITAYAIHDFLVANIIKNPNRSEYHSTVRRTFFAGTIIYSFICLGSFAIVNRTPFKQHPQTINDFFRAGEWQNSLIEVIYMIHMVTAYPNFLIISKVRFFQMFKIEIKHRIDWHQAVYIVIVVAGSFLIYIADVHLQVMITLNGAFIGFTYIVVIPIWIHLKCVFYDRSSGYIQNDPEWNSQIVPNTCECDNVYKNKFLLYLQTAFLILVVTIGLGLIWLTISQISSGTFSS